MEFSIRGVFRPKFFSLFKKGHYSTKTFASDLAAGIIVGIIALPLAIAFGIASGVTPQQGLITAVIAGFLVSVFGGSRFLIGGPTGAFIVIVAGVVAEYGMQGLIIATIMAGVMLVVMGLCRMGAIFKFIPYPIVVGFTSGIALTIFSTQIKDFLGMEIDVPSGFIPQWVCYFSNIGAIDPAEAIMSVCCVLIIVVWGKINRRIPGSLIAILLATAAATLLNRFAGMDFATIGSKFPELASGLPMPKPAAPHFDYETVMGLVSPAFTIAVLCAVESLLAAYRAGDSEYCHPYVRRDSGHRCTCQDNGKYQQRRKVPGHGYRPRCRAAAHLSFPDAIRYIYPSVVSGCHTCHCRLQYERMEDFPVSAESRQG